MKPGKATPVRGSILVNPRFQLGLVAVANLLALVAIGVIGFATHVFTAKLQAKALELGLDPAHPLLAFLEQRRRGLFATFGFVVFVACGIVSIGALVVSHRIAGPIHRMRRHLEGIAAGMPPRPLSFRPRDHFRELADAFNRAFPPESPKKRPPSDESAA